MQIFLNALESILTTVMMIPYWITLYPTIWMSQLLSFVMSDSFIIWSYTGSDNPIIKAGLSVTQGMVNIVLVIFLVVIVAGMILNISQYGSQKMLVNLILVAMLVNFAPIIVGLVVDISNIGMSFFVSEIRDGLQFIQSTLQSGSGEMIIEEIERTTGGMTVSLYTSVALLLMQTFINMVIGFVMFLYVMLFLFRYIAIWMLTILSPIAFVSLIHPLIKKWWNEWWSQLIQWSFVGMFGAFFLYLSLKVNEALVGVYTAETVGDMGHGFRAELASFIFPLFVVAAFFIIGFMMSLKTSAMGADRVINFAEDKRKRAQKYAGERAKEKRVDFLARQVSRPGIQKFAQRMATTETPGSRKQGLGGWAKRQSAPIFGTIRSVGRMASTDIVRNEKDIVSAEQKRVESMSSKEKSSAYQGAQTDAKRLGIIAAAHASGETKDIMKDIGERVKSDLPNIFKVAERTGKSGEISLIFPNEYLRNQDKRGGRASEELKKEGKTEEQIESIRKDEKERGVKTNEELLKKVKKMSEEEKKGRSNEQIITDIREEDEKKYDADLEKLSARMRKKPENIQLAASSIADGILKGDEKDFERTFELVANIIKNGKPSHIQSIIDGSKDGKEAFDTFLNKHYDSLYDHGLISKKYSDWNIEKDEHKKYIALHEINPGVAERVGKGIQELIIDIETPEKKDKDDSGLMDIHGNPLKK